MKRLTLAAAEYFKRLGFPQTEDEGVEHWYCEDGGIDTNLIDEPICSAPTYAEVWFWLWRVKKMMISVEGYYITQEAIVSVITPNGIPCLYITDSKECPDPEDALADAIEHIAIDDLFKLNR